MKWGRLLHEAAMPAGPHRERHAGLGEDRRSRRPPFLRPRGCGARSRRARSRRQDRQGSRDHAPARPAVGAAPRRQVISVPRARSQPASAAGCPAQRASTSPSSPRPSASCSSPHGRRTTRAATSIIAPARCRWSRRWKRCPAWSSSTCSARPRCRPCARNSTAPATPASRITSSTSTATASMTATSASAGCASSDPRTSASSRSAGTSSSSPDDARPAAARSPHPARLPRSLPDRAGRAGVRVGRVRAAEGRRGLRGRHEPQRAGRDRAPLRRGVLRRAGRRANAWATPCWRASARSRTTPSAAASSARASCGSRIGSCPCSSRRRTTRSSSRPRPRKQTRADFRRPRSRPASASCPPEPETGFIGRSRELLALQRLLRRAGEARVRALRRGARPGRRRQDRARRRVRPLAGPLAADAPRRVRLGRDAQPRRRGARCPRPPACGAGLLRRHVRRPGEGHPAGRARAGRAGDAAGGGQHGERPPAALPGGGNAGGPLRGRAPRAGRHPRALRAGSMRRATRGSSSPAARRCPRRSPPSDSGGSCTGSTARTR